MTSSTASRSRGTGRVATAWSILAVILAAAAAFHPGAGLGRTGPGAALPIVPGGFLESATTGLIRPRLSFAEIQSLLPARGAFTFPPPYGTTGVRLSNAGDCAGGDCVDYVGYSYWRNINNHVGQDEMLILLGLDRTRRPTGSTPAAAAPRAPTRSGRTRSSVSGWTAPSASWWSPPS